jgi:hypothetical protein
MRERQQDSELTQLKKMLALVQDEISVMMRENPVDRGVMGQEEDLENLDLQVSCVNCVIVSRVYEANVHICSND